MSTPHYQKYIRSDIAKEKTIVGKSLMHGL